MPACADILRGQMLKAEVLKQYPDFPWLQAEKPESIAAMLRQINCLAEDERVVRTSVAGAGNMNLTIRAQTNCRSVIVKQARPWVEKYDHISAPWDRICFEVLFYGRLTVIPELAARVPRLIASDRAARVMVLEDLGQGSDFTNIYSGARIENDENGALASFIRALHDATQNGFEPQFANREMRSLNHEHIYNFPLTRNNGLSLDRFESGLGAAAEKLKDDEAYVRKVAETGFRYLRDGDFLLHGDYFPGSWLRTENGPKVIDPEFCYYGDREFDVGFAVAHLILANDPKAAGRFVERYGLERLDMRWVARYSAAEIMRRLIGVSQLPIPVSTGWRVQLLDCARQGMMNESLEVYEALAGGRKA